MKRIYLSLLFAAAAAQGADVYSASPTAHTIARGGIYLDSPSPADALAANPALLDSIGRPTLELTGMSVFAGGHYTSPADANGRLDSGLGTLGAAAFGMHLRGSRFSFGVGAFPTSTLADRWTYIDLAGTAGASYGRQSNRSAFLAIQSSAGMSFRLSPRVSLGASLGVVENLNTLEAPYIFQANPTLKGLKTLLRLHTRGLGYNGTFGIRVQASRRASFAAAWKTRTSVDSHGSANGDAYAQFAALGIAAPSGFHYDAAVRNIFPQSFSLSGGIQMTPKLRLLGQTDWLGWHNAFTELPVHLTNGTNSLINSLLNSTTLNDAVPLHWKNQLFLRAAADYSLGESMTVSAAFTHSNSPVPAATLTPLTAAIMRNGISAGFSVPKGRALFTLAWQANLPESAHVGTSSLAAGEYNNSTTSLWIQSLALTTSYRF